MPAIVRVPTPLRDYTGGEAEVAVHATTVGEALGALVERYPRIGTHLYAEDGSLREFVNVYRNDEHIRTLEGEDTAVNHGDVVTIVPSIAGGAGPAASAGTAQGREAEAAAPPSPAHPLAPSGRGDGGAVGGLTPREMARYSRHLVLPEVGPEGQEKLKAARVLIVGAGGLGSPLALYLAAAGVGTLGLVDFDAVDATNLQRQVLYGTSDVGRPKLEAAMDRLRDINPHVRIVPHATRLTSENALEILEPYDVVVDGTDNFPTRYLVNDACVLLGKPNVYGSILRFEGQVSVFHAERGPCYRCLFREPPPPGLVPSCAEGGVLGVLPGIIGSLQALETIKLILGRGRSLVGHLLLFDALSMRWRELALKKNPDCPVCGDEPTQTGLIDYEEFCGLKPEEQDMREDIPQMTPVELKERLDRGERLTLIDVREPHEWEICNLGSYGARLVPLNDLSDRIKELNPDTEIVLLCKYGGRSTLALRQLQEAGFKRLWNLKGGILAWADEVDPSVQKY